MNVQKMNGQKTENQDSYKSLLLLDEISKGESLSQRDLSKRLHIALGLVNSFVRPLMVLLTLPLTVLTLGLFLLVVNALMLGLVSMLVPGIQLKGFGSAILGSLLLSLLNLAITALIGPEM